MQAAGPDWVGPLHIPLFMRDLLNFFLKYSSWLLFLLYAVISCVMLFTTNPYQHHVYLTSAGRLASSVYSAGASVSSYFSLRDINDDLQRRNAELEMQVLDLQQRNLALRDRLYSDTMTVDTVLRRYSFIVARAINSSTTRPFNYITIQKGELDGVKPEMGVVDRNGVVGIVNITGKHTARIISLLNPHLRLSCKVKGSQHVGSLTWDGRDAAHALLEELPRHAKFHKGDTIVTSGFSTSFPEGVPVGVVESGVRGADDNFYSLRIRLSTDFSTLSYVRVIRDALTEDIRAVEEDIETPSSVSKAQ